jgi:hypothetical protein
MQKAKYKMKNIISTFFSIFRVFRGLKNRKINESQLQENICYGFTQKKSKINNISWGE